MAFKWVSLWGLTHDMLLQRTTTTTAWMGGLYSHLFTNWANPSCHSPWCRAQVSHLHGQMLTTHSKAKTERKDTRLKEIFKSNGTRKETTTRPPMPLHLQIASLRSIESITRHECQHKKPFGCHLNSTVAIWATDTCHQWAIWAAFLKIHKLEQSVGKCLKLTMKVLLVRNDR